MQTEHAKIKFGYCMEMLLARLFAWSTMQFLYLESTLGTPRKPGCKLVVIEGGSHHISEAKDRPLSAILHGPNAHQKSIDGCNATGTGWSF